MTKRIEPPGHKFRSEFFGFYPESPESLHSLWRSAYLVIDANVLLHFHRGTLEYQQTLMEALRLFKGRVFIPNQIALEYHLNRLKVIEFQNKNVVATLEKLPEVVASHLRPIELNRHLDLRQLIVDVQKAVDQRMVSLKEVASGYKLTTFAADESAMDRLEALEAELGPFPNKAVLEAWDKAAEKRYADKQPPGYKDEKKTDFSIHRGLKFYKKFGDFYLWSQILERFKDGGEVIFLTDDSKEDWWEISQGQTISPRRELREEARASGLKGFWCYEILSFLKQAQAIGLVELSSEVESQANALSSEKPEWETLVKKASALFGGRILDAAMDSSSVSAKNSSEWSLALSAKVLEAGKFLETPDPYTIGWSMASLIEALGAVGLFLEIQKPKVPFEQWETVRSQLNESVAEAVRLETTPLTAAEFKEASPPVFRLIERLAENLAALTILS